MLRTMFLTGPAVLLGALLLTGAVPATAPPPSSSPTPRTLTVAMGGSYWPLHDERAGGAREGLEADLARDLGRLLGMEVRFVGRAETGMGAVEAVAAGKADVGLSSITPTDERRKLVDFTKPYLVLHYRLAAPEAGAAAALEPAEKRIAAPRGPALAVAKALFPRASVAEVASPDAAAQAVAGGKVDLAFGEDVGLVLAIQGTPLRLVGPPLAESPIAIAVPKGSAARYDEALGKLAGRLAELVERYRPGEPPEMPDDVYLNFPGGVDQMIVHVRREPLSVSLEDEPPEGDVEWTNAVDGEVQASVAVRRVARPAAATLRTAGKFLSSPERATWLRLPDGTYVGFEKVTEKQECGGEEMGPDGKMVSYRYDCPNHEYRLVAVRGTELGTTTFTVSEGT